MKKGKKHLTDLEKKSAIAYYLECQSYTEVAKEFGVDKSTICRLIKKQDSTKMQQLARKKSEENANSVLEAMELRKDKKIEILDKILDAIKIKAEKIDAFTSIKDLATAYGIILDKELKIKELELNKLKNESDKETLERLDEVLKNINGVI